MLGHPADRRTATVQGTMFCATCPHHTRTKLSHASRAYDATSAPPCRLADSEGRAAASQEVTAWGRARDSKGGEGAPIRSTARRLPQ